MSEAAPRRTLWIVSVGPEVEIPPGLGRELDRRFGTRSRRGVPLALPRDAYHEPSGQYLSGRVVDALIDRADAVGIEPGRDWTLGITAADLCAPGLSFVFGEATVGGCCALVSLARLREGAEGDPGTFERRLLVEAVHEMGHLAGLGHCPDPGCVMFASAEVEDSDRKGPEPCAECAERLRSTPSHHDA